MSALELLSKYFYLKAEAKHLKKQRTEISKELGGCEAEDELQYRCFLTDIAIEDYCEPCQKKDPISKRLRTNAHERVAIMNRLRKMAKDQPNNTKAV